MDISSLKYPKKSHRKLISIPSESPDLAELIGIEFGDGGIANKWQLVISLNSVADKEYSEYVRSLLNRLFTINAVIRKRPKRNNLVVVCTSISMVDFLVSKGVLRGNKLAQHLNIPIWIKQKPEYTKKFIRGLIDTDGCLYTHKHIVQGKHYSNIGFCFSSYSDELLNSVFNILKENGLKAYIRTKKHNVYLYSEAEVVKYLHIFGSSNPRIYKKYANWKGVRVVYSADLESLYGRKAIRGSNPLPSAAKSAKWKSIPKLDVKVDISA